MGGVTTKRTNKRRTGKDGRDKCRNCSQPPVPDMASCEYHLLLDRKGGKDYRARIRELLKSIKDAPVLAPAPAPAAPSVGSFKLEIGNRSWDGKIVDGRLIMDSDEKELIRQARERRIEAEKRYDQAVLRRERAEKRGAEAKAKRLEIEARIAEMEKALKAMGREDLLV